MAIRRAGKAGQRIALALLRDGLFGKPFCTLCSSKPNTYSSIAEIG